MIKSEHAHTELAKLEEVKKSLEKAGKHYESASLQASILAVKLLLNIRQNQVVDLTSRSVELIKPKIKNGTAE